MYELLIFSINPKERMEPAKAPEAFNERDPADDEYRPIHPVERIRRGPRAKPPKRKGEAENTIRFAQIGLHRKEWTRE